MRRLMFAAALMLAVPVGAHASLESLAKDAKNGTSVAYVMQQAKAEGTPVDTLLAELIKNGVVRGENIKDAVAAAAKADPARVGATLTVALSSFKPQAAAILKAAYTNAPDQASQIAASAKAAGISDKVVAAAQKAAADAATGLNRTTSQSNINVAPFSTPNSGGGGGGSASPN